MKIRYDFVTNSSSSSFVISRDHISLDKLQEIILEIANEELKSWQERWPYDDSKPFTSYDEIAYRYVIHEGTAEKPYSDYEYTYDNDFIVENDTCGRYDWDAIEDVLNKYNIPCRYGYCD